MYAVLTGKCLDMGALYCYYKPISVGLDWPIVWSYSPNTMAVDCLDMAAVVAPAAVTSL